MQRIRKAFLPVVLAEGIIFIVLIYLGNAGLINSSEPYIVFFVATIATNAMLFMYLSNRNEKGITPVRLRLHIEQLVEGANEALIYFHGKHQNNYYPEYGNQSIRPFDYDRIKTLLDILSYQNDDIILKRRKYIDLPKSKPEFYRTTILFSIYFLINNEIDEFVDNYRHFRSTFYERTEVRIMGERLNELDLYTTSLIFDFEIFDLFFDYYGNGKDISGKVMDYTAKNALHDLIFTYSKYHYLKAVESHSELDQLETKIDELKEIRKKL